MDADDSFRPGHYFPWFRPGIFASLLGAGLLCGHLAAWGQQPAPASESPGSPAGSHEPVTTDPEPALFPNLRQDALIHDGKRFWIRPIAAILADYTFFDQDAPSVAQVGEQEDTRDLRAARFGALLRSKARLPWEMYIAFDYQEPRTREDTVLQLYDLRFRLPLGRVKLDIGKQKQPFVYEMVGLSLINPSQERILSPFFVTRSIGMQLSGPLAGDRMTWAAGWYNDWLDTDLSFSDNASDLVGRLTGLAAVSEDNRDYLHFGIGLRRAGADAGLMRLRGRPESNVADYYLDTGDFPADYSRAVSLEAVWNRGPLSLQAEHIETWIQTPGNHDPHFSGSYLLASWFLTGENRPYNRALGFAGQALPKRRTGAVELVARYSRIDLVDAEIDGGQLQKWYVGVNWWASREWKLGVSWGDAGLDRDDLSGNTDILLFRLQWFH